MDRLPWCCGFAVTIAIFGIVTSCTPRIPSMQLTAERRWHHYGFHLVQDHSPQILAFAVTARIPRSNGTGGWHAKPGNVKIGHKGRQAPLEGWTSRGNAILRHPAEVPGIAWVGLDGASHKTKTPISTEASALVLPPK
jgi:hypothetical protein